MNNKLNNMINEFLENTNLKDEKELDVKLQEFMQKYNNGEIEYEDTILDEAYDLLEKAENAKSKKTAIKYAKQAYDTCPDCFDAVLFLASIEENPIKRWKIFNEGLKFEKDRLDDEGYFKKDNIGHFYLIFETRPYMRGLFAKANYLITDGKMKQAKEVCKEILKLNENDNLGARYLLMAINAYLEDEKEMLDLYKKYPEDNLGMLIPLLVLYFKQDNNKKVKEYLNKIKKANPYFIKFFKVNMKEAFDVSNGYYQVGKPSEVASYFMEYMFLLHSVPTLSYSILEQTKSS